MQELQCFLRIAGEAVQQGLKPQIVIDLETLRTTEGYGLIQIGNRLGEATEIGPSLGALEKKLGQFLSARARGRRRIGFGAQLSRSARVRLLLIENGRDVCDSAWRRNEALGLLPCSVRLLSRSFKR